MSTLLDHNGNPVSSGRKQYRRRRNNRLTGSGYYEAANISRVRSNNYWGIADWNQTAPKGIRDILMAHARHLVYNSGEIRGLLRAMSVFSIGTGLRPQSQVDDEGLANEYEAYFLEWAENADYFTGASFWEIQRLVSTAVDRDGDIGIAFVGGGKLQLFESQQIVSQNGGGKISDGIEYDTQGRPIAYHTQVTDALTGDMVDRRHLAGLFSLVFTPERPGQSRGVSALAHGINDGVDFADLMGFAKLGLKQREAIGFVIQSDDGVADPLSDPSATFRGDALGEEPIKVGDDENEEDLIFNYDIVKPGCVPRLRPNEKIEMLSDSRPSNSFSDFIETLLARISSGMGIPLEVVWPAKHSPTGPAMRAILTRAQTTFDTRADLIENTLCSPVWRWIIGQGILEGTLRSADNWQKAKWSRPPKLSIDAGRDSHASLAELHAGTQTLEADAELRGKEWKSVREQREIEAVDALTRADRIAKQFGISIDSALAMLTDTRSAIGRLSEIEGTGTGSGSGSEEE